MVIELSNLLISQSGAMHALTQELGRVRVDLERNEVGRSAVDRLFIGITEIRLAEVAIKEAARAATYHLDRGGRQSNLKPIEPIKDVAIDIVDAAMGLVGDDEVEKAGIERLANLHHCRIATR